MTRLILHTPPLMIHHTSRAPEPSAPVAAHGWLRDPVAPSRLLCQPPRPLRILGRGLKDEVPPVAGDRPLELYYPFRCHRAHLSGLRHLELSPAY
jgi:hypothetical protein